MSSEAYPLDLPKQLAEQLAKRYPQEAKRIREELRRTSSPPSLSDYLHSTCVFRLDPWQVALCDRLQRLCSERGQRILIHAPPQWGKSIIISQRLPVYYLGIHPLRRVKLACYNISHATRFGAVCRNLAQGSDHQRIFPRSSVLAGQPRGEWSTQARQALGDGQPSFAALGLQTGFVGQGADLLIIDDPYASPQDAASEAVRESVWTFWDESARVRLTDDANVVVMFHRYHEDDLAGRLMASEGLRRNGGRWELLRFSAEADGLGDDPLDRAIGERLSPRMSDSYLAEQKRSGFAWDGQFQGLPGRKGGNLFQVDRIGFVNAAPVQGACCRAWDMAATAAGGDFTAGVKILRGGDGLWYILDVIRGQWDTAQRNRIVLQTAELDGRACQIAGEQEPGSAGKSMASEFIRMLAGFPVITLPASGSKEVRADPLSAQVNAGNVLLVRGDWNKEFLEEMRRFPLGKHDDQIDAAALAFNRLSQRIRAGAL